MKLMTERIKGSRNFHKLRKLLLYYYTNKEKSKKIVSYNKFKELLTKFIEEIMSNYLNLLVIDGKPSFKIEKIKNALGSQYITEIKIDEKIIEKIYEGNIINLFCICHELIHFKYLFDIINGKVNKNTVDVLKEMLIWDDGENRGDYFKYYYYDDNYPIEKEEILADLEGVKLLKKILKLMDIELSKIDLEKLELIYNRSKKCDTDERSFIYCYMTNEIRETFTNWFDYIIEDHPEWLEFKQLQIEYYIDREGNVRKRSNEELLTLQKETENDDIKKYINTILNPTNEKEKLKYEDCIIQKKLILTYLKK